MIYLCWIAGIITYLIGGGFTFGYVARRIGYSDPWDGPGPILSALIWPFTMIVGLSLPIMTLGKRLAESQIKAEKLREKKLDAKKAENNVRIRIEELAEEKAKRELYDIERELEEQLSQQEQLFHEESVVKKKKRASAKK
jgi:hypothetical protein